MQVGRLARQRALSRAHRRTGGRRRWGSDRTATAVPLELVELRQRGVEVANQPLVLRGQVVRRRIRHHPLQRLPMRAVPLPHHLQLPGPITAPHAHRAEVVRHLVTSLDDYCKEHEYFAGHTRRCPAACGMFVTATARRERDQRPANNEQRTANGAQRTANSEQRLSE